MSNIPGSPPNPADPFTRFWSDFMAQASANGFPSGTPAGQDASRHMQRIFLDAMAKYADDFMRSPQFLAMLKQMMDNAMAFKQQMDGFIGNALRSSQFASRDDAEAAAAGLQGFERRMSERLEEMSERLASLESKQRGGSASAGRRAPHKSRPVVRSGGRRGDR